MSPQKETKACARLENNSSPVHFNEWPADGRRKPGTGAWTTPGCGDSAFVLVIVSGDEQLKSQPSFQAGHSINSALALWLHGRQGLPLAPSGH